MPKAPPEITLLFNWVCTELVASIKAMVAAVTPFVDEGVIAPKVSDIAGVVVGVATAPLTPLAVVTDTEDTVPEGAKKVPAPLKNLVASLGGVGTAPPIVEDMAGRSAPVAILKMPVVVVLFRMPEAKAPRNCGPLKPASLVPWTINLFASAILAEPLKLVPAIVLAVVSVAADPVVD